MKSDIVVHIVDDEEPVRTSLAFLLSTSGFAVRTHATAASFLASGADASNACLITDIRMPDIDGVELLWLLRSRNSQVPAIVVTGHGDVQMAVEAMKNGAFDFIEKPLSDEVLIGSIRRAIDVAASAQDTVEAEDRVRERLISLSEREVQVLRGMVQGRQNKAIALELGISHRTVEVYRANLMSKMQAHSLAELIRMVMRVDLQSLGDKTLD